MKLLYIKQFQNLKVFKWKVHELSHYIGIERHYPYNLPLNKIVLEQSMLVQLFSDVSDPSLCAQMYDTDRSGSISKEELASMLRVNFPHYFFYPFSTTYSKISIKSSKTVMYVAGVARGLSSG